LTCIISGHGIDRVLTVSSNPANRYASAVSSHTQRVYLLCKRITLVWS